MPHEARSIRFVRAQPHVNGQRDVMHGQEDDEDQPDDPGQRLVDHLLDLDGAVLLPVQDEGGQVRGDQGVDPARGPSDVGLGVGDRGAQRPGENPAQVDQRDPEGACPAGLLHLEADADDDLHDHVEDKVSDANVNKPIR